MPKPNIFPQVILLAKVHKVLMNFGRVSVVRLPSWVGFEGICVDVGGHVARTSWIAVLEPRPADFVVLFIAHQLVVAELALHFVGGAEAGGAGADVDYAQLSGLRVPLLEELEGGVDCHVKGLL